MKKGLVIAGVAVGAVTLLALKKYGSLSNMLKGSPLAKGPSNVVSGPSGPRADNASQPWYTQGISFLTSQVGLASQQIAKNPTGVLDNAGSVVHSVADFAGISSWFSSSSTVASADDTAISPAADLNRQGQITDITLPASDADQSNMIGAQVGYPADAVDTASYDPVMTADSSSANFGNVGSSNSDFSAA
jgi:hypothetical protein